MNRLVRSQLLPTYCIAILALALLVRISTNFTLISNTRRFEALSHPTYKYKGSDFPQELPGDYSEVAMAFRKNDSSRYPLDDNDAWATQWPEDLGLVRIGPSGRPYGISLYHQLHCLSSIRYAYMTARLGLVPSSEADTTVVHNTHCFHFIRQSILCHGDLTLVPVNSDEGEDEDELHRCRDWTKVRAFAEKNHEEWKGIPMNWKEMGYYYVG